MIGNYPSGMFGAKPKLGTPPFNPASVGVNMDLPTVSLPPDYRPEQPIAETMAQKPNGARRWAGILADALAGAAGRAGPYAAMLAQQRERTAMLADEQRKRSMAREDWLFQEQWKRDHPAPINNDTANDYAFWESKLTPEQFATWKQNRIDPPQYRQGADGQFYRVSAQQPAAAPAGVTFTPIDGGPQATPAGTFP